MKKQYLRHHTLNLSQHNILYSLMQQANSITTTTFLYQ